MKAVVCVEHGPPEALVYQDVPTPEPGRGQVRLKVEAAGVNFPDSLIIQNLYQFKPALPFSPGGEAAGVIDAVGEGVEGLSRRRPRGGDDRQRLLRRICHRQQGAGRAGARRDAVRRRRRLHHDLWHVAPCAQAARQPAARRDAARPRRGGRGRADRGRARQGDGGEGHRRRVDRRQARAALASTVPTRRSTTRRPTSRTRSSG